jgi:hypothetical protein
MCPVASRNSLNPLVLAFCHGGGPSPTRLPVGLGGIVEPAQGMLRAKSIGPTGPIPPRSGSENRVDLRNVVQNLVQLRTAEAPIVPLGSSLIH